ncbi:chromosome segregation protein SMC, partial [Thermodesulfobacteriota bacterium]
MIFSGSEKFSALGMAEVKITFTNDSVNVPVNYSEYSEITVSRRLYKSGESEYRINNTKCRLMDIRELFMDTGISSTAYAIIEQGKVESIVNSKPADKRVIIEEAAGITKYKNRKDAAEKKIAATNLNLQRTKDILHEIKKQLNAVEKQAKRAESFKNLRKEFKDIELKLICVQNQTVHDNLKALESDVLKINDKHLEVSKDLKVKDNSLETLKIKILEVEKELSATQEKYLERLNEVKKRETEIEYKERRKEELHSHKNSNLIELETLKLKVKELKDEIETLKRKTKDSEEGFLTEQKRVHLLTKEFDDLTRGFKEKENKRDKERSRLVNVTTSAVRARNDISNIEQHLGSFSVRNDKLKKEQDYIAEQIHKSSKNVKDFENAYFKIDKERENIKNELVQNELKLSDLNETLDSERDSLNSNRNELNNATSLLKTLSELKESYEGFNPGVRSVMEATKELGIKDDILGVVTDFIDVQSAHETAVGSVLGERLEYIVAKSRESIIKSIEYLKEHDLGKAGFILLSDDKTPATKSNKSDSHLSKLINIKDKVKGIMSALFKDVHYVETFSDAIESFATDSTSAYVTSDGDIVDRVIYGGGKKKAAQILTREREIKELVKKKSDFEKLVAKHEKALSKVKAEIDKVESSSDGLKDSLHDVEIRSVELKNNIRRAKDEKERQAERENVIKFEMDDIKSQTDQMNNSLLLNKVKLEELLAEKESINKKIEEYSDECNKINESLSSKNDALREAMVNVARLENEKENIKGSIRHRNDTLESNLSRLDKLKNSNDIIDKEEEEIKLRVKDIEGQLKDTIKKSEADKKSVDKLKEDFQKNMELTRNSELESSRIKHDLTDINAKKHELTLKKDEAKLTLNNIEEKLRDKHQMTIDDLTAIGVDAEFDKNAAVHRLDVLRRKISDMGEVNLLAIDEYEELNERYTFLMEQQEDLLKSIHTLNKAIKRINRTSQKRFVETFALVNERFKAIFPRLFNGGHAELRLVDEENVLETGVEIVAEPPGKKLKSISLLSGGERALTAVSLIFAIFMIKPTPFCLLDEVDAPLDDANVGRFTDLVRELSETSQFIIITHSKKTMEIADSLYGVTMESPGISKIVSVRMN